MEDPTFPKKQPLFCCKCKEDTVCESKCHVCGHWKGRFKFEDKHHCVVAEEELPSWAKN